MLSSFYLSFKDKETQQLYINHKREYHARILPLITLTQAGLTAALIMYTIRNRSSSEALSENVTYINLGATAVFALLATVIRYSSVASWFVCPIITGLAFYYFAFLDYTQDNVSTIFTIVVAINTCYFILALFNEVWLISVSVYAPLLIFYMWKMGDDFTGGEDETSELVLRCIFCVLLYASVAYNTEKSNKKSFLGEHSQQMAQTKWLKIFEKLPDGVALVQDGEVSYANQALGELMAFKDYLGGVTDLEHKILKKRLEETMVQPLLEPSNPTVPRTRTLSAWNFIDAGKAESAACGGPVKLLDQAEDTYLSLNTVEVNVAGREGKLFVVRDMSALVSLQGSNFSKQLFGNFTEKILVQIQETGVNLIEVLQNVRDNSSAPKQELKQLDIAITEAKKVVYRVFDYEQIYNIHEGTSQVKYEAEQSDELLRGLKSLVAPELSRQGIEFETLVEDTLPEQINTQSELLKQVFVNIVSALAHGTKDTSITFTASGYQTEEGCEAVLEIHCAMTALTSEQNQALIQLCQEPDITGVMQSEMADTNVAVAKLICLDLGWHLEFRQLEDMSGNFFMVIPAQRYDQQDVSQKQNSEMQSFHEHNQLRAHSQQLSEPNPIQNRMLSHDGPIEGTYKAGNETELLQEDAKSFQDKRLEPLKPKEKLLSTAEVTTPINLLREPNLMANQEHSLSEMNYCKPQDCLLVSYLNNGKQFMHSEFGLDAEDAHSEAQALELISKAVLEKKPYRFILLDLDDPTLFIGRFMRQLEKILGTEVKMDVYACSENNSAQMVKKCESRKVSFLHKPLTRENCLIFAERYPVEEGQDLAY